MHEHLYVRMCVKIFHWKIENLSPGDGINYETLRLYSYRRKFRLGKMLNFIMLKKRPL